MTLSHHSRCVVHFTQAVKKNERLVCQSLDSFKNQEHGEWRATVLHWDAKKEPLSTLSPNFPHPPSFADPGLFLHWSWEYTQQEGAWRERKCFPPSLLRSPSTHPLVFPYAFSFLTLLYNFFSITQTSLLQGTAFEPPLKLTTKEKQTRNWTRCFVMFSLFCSGFHKPAE